MSILVPIDDTETSRAALRAAQQMAHAEQARLVVVTVGELSETSSHARDTRAALRKRLEQATEGITNVPLSLHVQLAGDPVRGILEVADEEHVDRIVIASEQRGPLALFLHDSVAREVREEARVPVTVIETGAATA